MMCGRVFEMRWRRRKEELESVRVALVFARSVLGASDVLDLF
jgi:hypothetical protein